MKVWTAEIADVLVIEPKLFADHRGYFFESYNKRALASYGVNYDFVQDNVSMSYLNVLRGLHYQLRQPQGKLVRVLRGEVLDVAVDIRRQSETFGRWVSFLLSEKNRRTLWIPPGFAHGFIVRSGCAEVHYKTTDYYAPDYERAIRWNDPDIGIDWQLRDAPIMSARDESAVRLADAEVFE